MTAILTHQEWRFLLQTEAQKPPEILVAETFLKSWPSFSKPCVLAMQNGEEYVVKMRQASRPEMDSALFIEQSAGILGVALGAPVASVRLVAVPQFLIDSNAEMSAMLAGLAHGCLRIPNVTERGANFAYSDRAYNRNRYALLAVLYGLVGVRSDYQFFYGQNEPNYVYSFDHGWSLGHEGQPWNMGLFRMMPPPHPDQAICTHCCLTEAEIKDTLFALRQVDDTSIAHAIAWPPLSWNILMDDRILVALEIAARRDHMVAYLSH